MALNAEAKLNKLLEQINYQDPSLSNGSVENVIVHKKSRIWEIHLHFSHVLPADVYRGLSNSLQMSFHNLANAKVKLIIRTSDNENDPQKISDYWRFLAQREVGSRGMGFEIAEQTIPEENNGRIELALENEQVKEFVANKFLGKIEQAYQQAGFAPFRIHAIVDQTASQEMVKEIK